MLHLDGLSRYRYLLWQWTARELRVRYKQSLLGAGWAVLQPLALTVIFTVVFSVLVRIETGGVPYPVFVYVALVPWTFFANSLTFGIPSLVNNMNLVTKIYFPREILPLGTILAALLDYVIAALVLVAMMLYYRLNLSVQMLWVFPLLALQMLFAVAVTLAGAALLVFVRDVRFVVPLLLQVWMYATPVIYPIDMVPAPLRTYVYLNPMAGIIDGYRRAFLLGERPDLGAMVMATGITVVCLVGGWLLFKRLEPHFADVI